MHPTSSGEIRRPHGETRNSTITRFPSGSKILIPKTASLPFHVDPSESQQREVSGLQRISLLSFPI